MFAIRKEKTAIFIFWLIYAALSFYFWKERNTYADNSYYLFNMLQKENFSFEHLRFIAAAWQWPTVLAVKLQLPLKAVMLSAVAGVYLWHLLLFIAIRVLSTEKWLSYIFLLFLIATIHDAFYYMQTELLNGCGLVLLLVAVVRNVTISRPLQYGSIALILCLLICTHLFALLIVLMAMGIYFLLQPDKQRFIYVLMTIIALALKMWVVKDGYDNNSMQVFDYRVITLRNLHSSFYAKAFQHYCRLYWPAIAFMWIVWWIHPKKWWVTVAVVAGVAGLYVLLVVYLRNGSFPTYIDLYTVTFFTFCWAVVGLLVTSDVMNRHRFMPLLLVMILLQSFVRLFSEDSYTKRVGWLDNSMQQPFSKMYLPLESAPAGFQMDSWSVPYETLLLSSLKGESKTILMTEPKYPAADFLQDSTLFLGAGWRFGDTTTLHPAYFRLAPFRYQPLQP